MPRPHPSPYSYRTRAMMTQEGVVGWFLVGFADCPDHEYPFAVYRDGSILPEIDDPEDDHSTMFARYLSAPDFHHVRFLRQEPISPQEADQLAGRPLV